MTEKFALEQTFRESGTVDADERLLASSRIEVQLFSDQLFPNAALTEDKYRSIAWSDPFNKIETVLHHLRRENKGVPTLLFLDFMMEISELLLGLLELSCVVEGDAGLHGKKFRPLEIILEKKAVGGLVDELDDALGLIFDFHRDRKDRRRTVGDFL